MCNVFSLAQGIGPHWVKWPKHPYWALLEAILYAYLHWLIVAVFQSYQDRDAQLIRRVVGLLKLWQSMATGVMCVLELAHDAAYGF